MTSSDGSIQQVGASVGSALLAVILHHHALSHAASGNAGLATAFGHTFWWAVGFTALALVPALFLPARRPIRPAEETLPVGVKPQAA